MKYLFLAMALASLHSSSIEAQSAKEGGPTTGTVKGAPLALQEMCARQSEHVFENFLLRNSQDKEKWFYDYTNHYNPEIGRCFLLVQGSKSDFSSLMMFVFDAYSRKSYASYAWVKQDKEGFSGPPVECFVMMLPTGEKKPCHSSDEFNKLVEFYMGK